MEPTITHVELDTNEVQRVICDQLAVALDGTSIPYAVMSMLTYCCLLMRPNIEFERLQEAVMSTSSHMILALSDPTNPKDAN